MSYLVLARKWRPQRFSEVIGQKHVTSTLQNALAEDRLAHALIFSGPRGVGKTSVARILAKAMNCEKGPAAEPCNDCGICHEITSGVSVDVQEIDGASNRGIDEIRELRDSVKFRPVRCRCKVYVIDEVHMLTKEAFNALLKTLEEPPSHVFFMFATTEPGKIPPTIHSRCQHYEFHRMPTELLANHLDHIVKSEGLELSRDATMLLAREAEGSVRDSLSLLDQVVAYGAVNAEQVCEALGLASPDTLSDMAFAMLDGDSGRCLEIIDRIHGIGGDMQKLASDLVTFFRNIAVLLYVDGDRGIEMAGFENTPGMELRERFRKFGRESILQVFDAVLKGQEQVFRSNVPRIALELLVIRACVMKQVVSLDVLIEKVHELAEKGGSVSSGQSARDNAVKRNGDKNERETKEKAGYDTACFTNTASLIDTGQEEQEKESSVHSTGPEDECDAGEACGSTGCFDASKWDDFVRNLKRISPLSASLLEQCSVSGPEDGVLVIDCATPAPYQMFSDENRRLSLEKELNKYFNTELAIRIRYDNNAVSPGSGPAAGGRDSLEKELKNHPMVQEALRIFNARIASIEPVRNMTDKTG